MYRDSDVQESRLDDIETVADMPEIQPNDSVSELVCSQEDIIISSYNNFKTCFSRAAFEKKLIDGELKWQCRLCIDGVFRFCQGKYYRKY